MSLDLFVNFERCNNNSVFYRLISAVPYSATARISSDSFELSALPNYFTAKYTINNVPSSLADFDLNSGVSLSFDRRYAGTHSIQVYLSAKNDPTDVTGYSMSVKFLDSFPTATFVAYPSSYFIEQTGEQITSTKEKYDRGPGLFFYGEGHTELIQLSARGTTANINWLVGNQTNSTEWAITPRTSNTATVKISSTLSQDEKIPIHLRLTTPDITLNGPIHYYDDATGEKKNYSFYDSSLLPSGVERADNKFKSHIHVRPYPNTTNYTFVPAFSSSLTQLPFDYTTNWFETRLIDKQISSLLYYGLSATTWQTDAVIDNISQAGNWSYRTAYLPTTNGYRFPLNYIQTATESIPILKISPLTDTTVTSTVSAFKKVQIQKFPYDWQPNIQREVYSSATVITTQPFVKLYTPNFLAIKNDVTYFEPLQVFAQPHLQLQKVSISSEHSNTRVLSGSSLQKPFEITFTKLGKQTLTVTSAFLNINTNQVDEVTNIIPDMVDVVEAYDDAAIVEYYHSTNTSLNTYELSAPSLSPNEWVTEKNINTVLEFLYEEIEKINNHTNLYVTDSNFYAWLGNSNYRWTDLECLPGNTDKLKWSDHVPTQLDTNSNGFPLFWNQQTCNTEVESDKTCLQKYCLEWRWDARRRANSTIPTTWKSTRTGASLAKKWSYEPCELDSIALPCDLGSWHTSTIDQEFFPLQFCGYTEGCVNNACIEIGNYLVIAKKTELVLVKNTYAPSKLHRAGLADTLYAFANIEGVCSAGNKVYVLDSLIPRVSVYEVENDRLTQVDSWGRFGLVSNAYGFNRPKDIAVDQNNSLYITDTGNKVIKKYTLAGKYLKTYKHSSFDAESPISVCIDSARLMHVLLTTKVIVLNQSGEYVTEYKLSSNVRNPSKIVCSHNREIIYVSHFHGVDKYFRTGVLFDALINKMSCSNGLYLEQFKGVFHNAKRELYICANDKILKYTDRMKLVSTKSPIPSDLYWGFDNIKIHKEEYIQSWVYLKAFHRLWDNVELIRNSLHYNMATHPEQKTYVAPLYTKSDITIGQNEIVTNSVINRLTKQLWTNIQLLANYFN
jgi:hypothetical protein